MPASPASRQPPFLLSATVDFPGDITSGLYTREQIGRLMAHLAGMGVRRVYWLYYGDIDLESYWAGGLLHFPPITYGVPTMEQIGEPLKAAVPIAHENGIELYGVLKPYGTGASGTYPEGSPEPKPNDIRRIGGTAFHLSPFIQRHPHTREKRLPYDVPPDLETIAAKKIRLLKKDDSPTRIKKENLEVWTSPDNYCYRRKDIDFALTEAVEPAPRQVRDYYGDLVTARGAPVRTLTMEGLDLPEKFILVTTNLRDGAPDFVNTPVGMIEAYGDGPDPLPIVVAARSVTWISPRDFRTYGLDFDGGLGTLQVPLDEDNTTRTESGEWSSHQSGGVIAFARGKNDYAPSMPCVVYPEVRKLWAGWIDRMLDTDVDGIDLRVSSHGNLVDEPWEYGFNEPVLDEYRQRYGKDFEGDDPEVALITQIRGEHYTDFVRETSAKVRAAGKKMQFHLHAEAFRPDPAHGQIMGFPANLDFQWRTWLREGLADGVTLRTSWFEAWEDPPDGEPQRSRLSMALADPVVAEALKLTSELNVPAYLNRYLARAVSLDEYLTDMETAYNDGRLAGFDLYETANIAHATPDGSDVVSLGDTVELIRAKARELGLA